MKLGVPFAAVLAATVLTSANTLRAEGQGGFVTLVTVNDIPITSFDVEQRVGLNTILGRGKGSLEDQRKRALQNLIDDQVKLAEAKKYNATPDSKMVDAQIDKMAKGSNTDAKGLGDKLKTKGSTMSALRTLVTAQIAFNRLITAMYKVKVEVEPAEIDKKYNEIANDPRLQPVTVYEIMEIEMPVEKTSDAMAQQLLVARAADAAQYRGRFKGCASARQAASGIYNVQISRRMQADGRKLPKQLKMALDKAGTGGLVGPARSKNGVQMIAFCDKKNIAPNKPSREQIETMLSNKKYDLYEERYMRELRRNAFIEYKDAKANTE
jgi:peptidyl-prolyl cis-trans isomerase SurA